MMLEGTDVNALALATKDLIRVKQDQPYGEITIELHRERCLNQDDDFNGEG
jgi:hypothetical protein